MIGQQMLTDNAPSQFVYYGEKLESYRPPILCIPDSYLKGFMFSQLDQILRMTKEQFQNFLDNENQKTLMKKAKKSQPQIQQNFANFQQ